MKHDTTCSNSRRLPTHKQERNVPARRIWTKSRSNGPSIMQIQMNCSPIPKSVSWSLKRRQRSGTGGARQEAGNEKQKEVTLFRRLSAPHGATPLDCEQPCAFFSRDISAKTLLSVRRVFGVICHPRTVDIPPNRRTHTMHKKAAKFAVEEKKLTARAAGHRKKRNSHRFQPRIGHRQQTHTNTLTKAAQLPVFGTETTPKRSVYEPSAQGSLSSAGSLTTRNDDRGKSPRRATLNGDLIRRNDRKDG